MSARRLGSLLLLGSSSLFGLMAVLVRAASRTLPVGETLLLRFGVATLGALVAVRALPPTAGGRRSLLVLRGALGGLAVVLYFYALASLPAATAALLNTSSPLFAILFARAYLGERPPAGVWRGVLVAAAGTGLVVWGSARGEVAGTTLGVAAGLLSAAFSGAAAATIRAARRHYNAGVVFLWFSMGGLVVSVPPALAARWAAGPGLLLALAAALAALGAQLVYTQALGLVETWIASALGQVTPVVAWLLGLAFLGERLAPMAAAGALLTCAGVAYTGLLGRAPRPA